jgi:hypothetical protein
MRRFRWILAMLALMAIVAASSPGWAEPKQKHRHEGWQEPNDQSPADHPPGWDKGKKTGWRGQNLPPGQRKKYGRSYDLAPDRRQQAPPPDVIPVPVPVPVPR